MVNWDWNTITFCGYFLVMAICGLVFIWESTVRCRKALQQMRARRHAEEMELLDKQIELERAKHPVVRDAGPPSLTSDHP